MSANSGIEWTDHTWNIVTGCTKVSQGCKNCYAEVIANRFWKDRKFTDVQMHPERLEQPLHWRKPSMIFVNSMSDLFHEKVPFEFIDEVFAVMFITPQHTYQILTKRPERMLLYMAERGEFHPELNKNIWMGVSIEKKENLDRIELLRDIQTGIRFISFEPLLEDLGFIDLKNIDWVIVGGESGLNKRPFDSDWARNLLKQCKTANVPFFMKQIDKIQDIPEDLNIREYPKVEK